MLKASLLASALALGLVASATPAPAQAQSSTRDQIRAVEREYARQHNGRAISDEQLEYYLDRMDSGWSMSQISQDMANSRRIYANTQWRPQTGWTQREVICTSIDNRYRECRAPFRGTAVLTRQISDSACIEGRSWGQRPGVIWVNRGCRARFGIVRTGNRDRNRGQVVCQSTGRYKECATGIRGRVELIDRIGNSGACREGRDWGQKAGVVWVNNGCRARFDSVGRPGPRDDFRRDVNYTVTCASQDNRPTRCAWDDRYGTPRLVQTLSDSACVQGRTWGHDDGRDTLWVSNGCRARFTSDHGRPGPRDDFRRDANYAINCSSQDNRLTRCAWDGRYGAPRLVQTLSDAACVEGRTWGYDNGRDTLWVNNGCRGRFVSR